MTAFDRAWDVVKEKLCEGCDIGAKEGDGFCDECKHFYSLFSGVKDWEEHQ